MKEKMQGQNNPQGDKMKRGRVVSIVVAGVVFVVSLFLLLYEEYSHASQKEMYEKLSEDYVTYYWNSDDRLSDKAEGYGSEFSSETVIQKETEAVVQKADDELQGNEIKDIQNTDEREKSDRPWYKLAKVDIESLQKLNQDICGWLLFENEDISYPILQRQSNDTYLRTNYRGESVTEGSIFMESKNHSDFSDAHTIIYGHNMRNETMFGKLKKYKNINDYYETHQFFQIFLKNKVCRYQIFMYKDVEVDDSIYQIFEDNNLQFVNFVLTEITQGSVYKSSMNLEEKMKENRDIITLSTCSSGEKRFVISAVKIDEIEY